MTPALGGTSFFSMHGPSMLHATLAFVACAIVPVSSRSEEQAAAKAPAERAITLPEGAIERAFAAVGVETIPIETPASLGGPGVVPAVESGAWRRSETWRSWSRVLAASVDSNSAATGRLADRALLCLLALEQGRAQDAWAHLAACGESPAWLAALLPRFLPGVPEGTGVGTGGRSAALADGVVLRPSLPPPSAGAIRGRIDRREMRIDGLAIGAAKIGLRVSVEVEGVHIEVEHQAGGAARLSVVIPEPSGFVIAHEYLDWYRQETRREPIALEVAPGDDVHTIYGRLEPRELALPTRLPDATPAQIESEGLVLEISPDDPDRARIDAVAASLSEGALGIVCVVREASAPTSSAPSGVVVDLAHMGEREHKLAWLVASIERFTLATRR